MADDAIPITRAEYAARFGGGDSGITDLGTIGLSDGAAPIPISRAEYAARFAEPKTEYSLSNVIPNITSGQFWSELGNDLSPVPGDIAGALGTGLKGLTANAGDEIIGAGNAIIDDLSSYFGKTTGRYDRPTGNYDQSLADARATIGGFEKEMPEVAIPLSVASSLPVPLPKGIMSVEKGLRPALGNIAKASGVGAGYGGAYGFGAGEGGFENRLEAAAEPAAYGALFGGGLQTLAEGAQGITRGVRGAIDYFGPNKDEALLKAFRATDAKANSMSGVLESLKDQGIVAKPTTKTPFNDTLTRLLKAQDDSRTSIGKALEGTETTIADVWPRSSSFPKKLGSGPDTAAAATVLRSEQDNLVKLALAKLSPAPKGVDPVLHAESLFADYKALQKAAAEPDNVAALMGLQQANKNIKATKVSGNELWQLRQGYDGQSTWNKIDPKGKAEAYRGLRDALQKKVVQLGGPETGEMFGRFANQMQGQKLIERMAGRESKGLTQAPNVPMQLAQGVLDPLSTLLRTFVGGIERSQPGEVLLKQAFGKSLSQKAGNVVDAINSKIPKSISGLAAPFGALSAAVLGETSPTDLKGTAQQESKVSNSSLKDRPTTKDTQGKSNSFIDKALDRAEGKMDKKVSYKGLPQKEVEKAIDSDPFYSATYEMESGRKPGAKNPKSSATGGFQLINATADSLGVKDRKDLGASFDGMIALTEEHKARFGDDPFRLYAAHFLGATTLDKWLKGKPLTEKQAEHVREFKTEALPMFKKIYSRIKGKKDTGVVKA